MNGVIVNVVNVVVFLFIEVMWVLSVVSCLVMIVWLMVWFFISSSVCIESGSDRFGFGVVLRVLLVSDIGRMMLK